MSLDLLTLSTSHVPFLNIGITILKTTYTGIENVKLYKQQCRDMSGRCVSLMVSLRDSSPGLEGTKVLEIADEIEAIIVRVDRKVKEWGSWSQLKSFLAQSEIKDGIDRLHRDIDAAMMKFNMQMGMEMTKHQLESKATQERDKAEIREVLQVIVKSQDDMRTLLNMQSSRDSRPVEEIMESLQTELMDHSLHPVEEEVFKAGLWMLHEETAKLPPLTDLSGQVTLSQTTVVKGAFNDIYVGQWLDKETVALRLPRTLANNADVQDHFQREVSIWREFNHPNVVPLYGIIHVEDDILSVSPWMDNGTADSYVKKHPAVDRLKILTDAASGLEYLHSKSIVHGDLRAANVLISKDGTARLSDFGLSKFMEDCGKRMTTSYSVNPRWFSPELLTESGPVSTHSDVWSFGMLCLEILSGDVPFADIKRDIAVLREIDNGALPKHPGRDAISQGLSDAIWQVLQKCWEREPTMRPSITEVKNSLLGRVPSVSAEPKSPTRKWPTFSLGRSGNRLSTSSETTSMTPQLVMPQKPRRPTTAPGASTGIPENEELSPLGIPSIDRGFMGNAPDLRHRQNSVASLNSSLNHPYSNPAYSIDFDHPSISPQRVHPRSASLSGAPTLSVPHLSTSLPARPGGSYFPVERAASRDSNFSLPARSVLSSDSSAHLSGPVREAVTDPRIIVNVNETGVVQSGTLEGLVERLIVNFNLRQDIEYRDVLLTACADFTTPEDFFGMLSRRFFEAESKPGQHPEDRVAVQYNIFMVIMYWLSNRHLQVDPQLLWQMRNFCDSAIRMKSSSTMVDKARDMLRQIDLRGNNNGSSPSLLSPGRKSVQVPQIKPNELAIALALLEGDKYKVLVPSDYIAHLRRHVGHNSVEGAYTANNKIIFWVKDSVLHYDAIEKRADVLKFFIHTAYECRKLRNFSSVVAIAIALHSAPIERLKLTKSSLTLQMQGKLQALYDIIDPMGNHRGYREALNDVSSIEQRDRCIPWLAVHLKELHLVLQRYPITVQVDGRPLINFQRYLKFMDRVNEVVHYKPPNLEQYRQLGHLDYLESQLRNVRMTSTSDDDLMARSKFLEARETLDFRTRRPQLQALGFRTR